MINNKQKGILLIIFSTFFFALMGVFVNLAGSIPFYQKTVFRNAVAMIAASVAILRSGTGVYVAKPCRFPLAVRVIVGIAAVYFNYYGIDHLPLASASSLNKTGPFFAILFAAVFLGDSISKRQALSIAVALAGCLLLIIPNLGTVGFASFIALMSGVATGIVHNALRIIRKRGEVSSSVIVFWFCSISTTIAILTCIGRWTPMSAYQVAMMILAGSSSTIGQYAMTAAFRYAPPTEISIFDFTQIVFSAIMGLVIFGQVPPPLSILAYILLISASLIQFSARDDGAKTA